MSVLVESDGHYMLYDGGDSNKSSFVVSYLKEQHISELDYVIASHYDSDHLNGVVGALNVFPTGQVYAPDYTADSRVYRSFNRIIADKGIQKTQPSVGETFCLGDSSIQILAPTGTEYADENDYSIAIHIQEGETSFLITGDATSESETEMAASGLELDSDVYVAGHHGSGSSSSWELLQKAVPEYAVISCGAGNTYGHPHSEVMERLRSMDVQILRTDKQGTIIGYMDGKTITWNTSPCNDYSAGDSDDVPPTHQETESAYASPASSGYILNTSTKKFHYPTCSSVKTMKESNKKASTESRDAIISSGYRPCGRCHP